MGSTRGLVETLSLFLLLNGCIPPGAPMSDGRADRTQPQIRPEEPNINTVYGEKPVWDARPVSPSASHVGGGSYTVQPGDNLLRIGEKTGAGADALARANGLSPPFIVKPGQRLIIPQGQFHRVAAGESGIAIARAYGVPWSSIVAENGLSEPYTLRVGQRLVIPGLGRDAAADPVETRAAAFKLDIDDILTGGEPADGVGAAPATPQSQPRAPLAPNVSVQEPPRFAGGFVWPVNGQLAMRFGPGAPGEINDGIDIAVAQNAPIVASSDGVVAFVGSNVAGYGGLILIKHGNGWITAYGRVGRASVTRGQQVRRGQTIGTAGLGASPLIHFEIRQGRTPVDPLTQLPKRGQ
jgi:lipoprotein NlpD